MTQSALARLRRLLGNDRGNTAILFAILLIPLAVAIGAGVDYGHAVQLRTSLQNTVDAAALSGVSAYTSPAAESTAQALAQSYVTKGLAALPSNVTVKSTTVTPGTQGGGNNVAYTMHASVTVTMPTTFMSFYQKSVTITASATAVNPVVAATFDTGSFVSYACDLNQIYWYVVPPNGGVPDSSAMNLLWSNNDGNPPSQVSFNIAASAQIGFAMKNTTGGRDPNLGGCNYGNNMYGAQPSDTQWLYSSVQPPSKYYNIAPGGADTGTHATYETTQDCALVVEKGVFNVGKNLWVYPSAPQHKCFSTSGRGEDGYNSGRNTFCYNCRSGPKMSSEMTNAAPSCSQLNGVNYQYDWNDMGANVDNLNYGNDMQYSFSCSGGSGSGNGTGTSGVTLTN